MNRSQTLIMVAGLLWAPIMKAQTVDTMQKQLETVIITATRFEVNEKESGRSVTVINREALEKFSGKTLTEILSELSSIHFDGAHANFTTNKSYYLRGGRNGQILVLIDGIPVNDPSDITAGFDFRHISPDLIERIEVLKGGVSAIYGTDAVAGVIHIYTRDAGKGKVNGEAGLSYGSYSTINGHGNINGRYKKWSYLAGISVMNTGGISAARDTNTAPLIDSSFMDPVRSPFDKDGFFRQNSMLKLSYKPSSSWDIGMLAKFDSYKASIDNGEFADDRNRLYRSRQLLWTLSPEYKYENGKGKIRLETSYYRVFREDLNDSTEFEGNPPAFSYLGGFSDAYFLAHKWQADLRHDYALREHIRLTTGVWYQHLRYSSESTEYGDFMGPRPGLPVGVDRVGADSTFFHQADPYISLFVDHPSGWNLSAALRWNYHSAYGSHLTYLLNPSYLFPLNEDIQLKIFGSLSSSFKSPTLYQLYSVFGNTELEPEESLNYEAGIAFYAGHDLSFQTSLFRRNESQRIEFVSGYVNAGSRKVEGLEINAEWEEPGVASLRFFHSILRSDDTSSLYRIPRQQYGMTLAFFPVERMVVSANFEHTGARKIFDFGTFSELTLDAYDMLNLYVRYTFPNEMIRVFASVNNLLNEDFQSIRGFSTRGRNYNAGISFHFK